MNQDRERPILIIRKKIYKSGHHGGAWKVAFADFMTTMMALFLVLWIVGQSSDVRTSIAGYFKDPLGHANESGNSMIVGNTRQLSRTRPMKEQEIIQLRRNRLRQLGNQVRERLKESVDLSHLEKYIEVQLVDDGLRIELLESSEGRFFELGKATPSSNGRKVLAFRGGELAALQNFVIIEGHTDARPYSSRRDYSNWELSTDRANAARRILVTGGLPEPQVVQVRGFADRNLRHRDDPLAPANRRVTITMMLEYTITDLSAKSAGSGL